MDAFDRIYNSCFMADMFEILCRPDDLHYNGVAGELYTRLLDYDEDIPLSLLLTNEYVKNDEYTAMRILTKWRYPDTVLFNNDIEYDGHLTCLAWGIIKEFMDDGGYETYDIPESVQTQVSLIGELFSTKI